MEWTLKCPQVRTGPCSYMIGLSISSSLLPVSGSDKQGRVAYTGHLCRVLGSVSGSPPNMTCQEQRPYSIQRNRFLPDSLRSLLLRMRHFDLGVFVLIEM